VRPGPFLAVGCGVALASIPLAAAAGPPYLSAASLNPWLVTYAIGLFTVLFAIPFALHARLGGRLEADARWERALLLWGAASIAVAALGVVLGLAGGLGSDSLAGSLGLVTLVEAGLVLATLVVWLLSG
jgi:hypothetical protein